MKKKFFPVPKLWLILIVLSAIAILIFPSRYIGLYYLKLNCWIVWTVITLPVLTAFIYFIKNGKDGDTLRSLLTSSKIRFLPLFLFYDPEPVRVSRFKPEQGWWKIIKEGDLLLRRHDNYIDGLILRQACYFTHAGIAKKEHDETISVYHAVGTGIHKVEINEFAHCDEIMVLRITEENIRKFIKERPPTGNVFFTIEKFDLAPILQNPNNKKMPDMPGVTAFNNKEDKIFVVNQLRQNANAKQLEKREIPIIPQSASRKNANENITLKDVRTMIEESGRILGIDKELRRRELETYDLLKIYDPKILAQNWQSIITGLAREYYIKNIPYDFSFDFLDPNNMSCVEFAWNCYKSFFPMHQVKRKSFNFFKLLNAFILVPDLFLNENKFTCIYTSGERFDTRKQLTDFLEKSWLNFWIFILRSLICQMGFLVLIYIVKSILILLLAHVIHHNT